MRFIETAQFTARVVLLGAEESLRKLQVALGEDPETGDVLKGTGGFRKVRMALPGRGKSGEARAIYYSLASRERIVLFYLLQKTRRPTFPRKARMPSVRRRQY